MVVLWGAAVSYARDTPVPTLATPHVNRVLQHYRLVRLLVKLAGFTGAITKLGRLSTSDRLRVGRGSTRAEDAQGTPTQSHISPSILVYEEELLIRALFFRGGPTQVMSGQMEQGHVTQFLQLQVT